MKFSPPVALPRLAWVGLGLAALSGCAKAEPVDERGAALFGAEAYDDARIVAITAVGPFTSDYCSASVVGRRLILTARHCVSEYQPGRFVCGLDGYVDESYPRSPSGAGEIGPTLPPEAIAVHLGPRPDLSAPGATVERVFAPDTESVCRNDIALLLLREPLEVPGAELRLDDSVFVGEPLTFVGYGTNEDGTLEQRRLPDRPVLAVGETETNPDAKGAMPRTFIVGPGPCHGDSGGPTFDEEGRISGVFSILRGDCASDEARSVVSDVAGFRAFVEDVLEETGEGSAVGGAAGAPPTSTTDESRASCRFVSAPGRSSPGLTALVGFLALLGLGRRVFRHRTLTRRLPSA